MLKQFVAYLTLNSFIFKVDIPDMAVGMWIGGKLFATLWTHPHSTWIKWQVKVGVSRTLKTTKQMISNNLKNHFNHSKYKIKKLCLKLWCRESIIIPLKQDFRKNCITLFYIPSRYYTPVINFCARHCNLKLQHSKLSIFWPY